MFVIITLIVFSLISYFMGGVYALRDHSEDILYTDD